MTSDKLWYWYNYGSSDGSGCGCCPNENRKWTGLLAQLQPQEVEELAKNWILKNREFDKHAFLRNVYQNDENISFLFDEFGDEFPPEMPDGAFSDIDLREWTEGDILSDGDIQTLIRERQAAEAKRREEERKKQEKRQREFELKKLESLAKKCGKTIS